MQILTRMTLIIASAVLASPAMARVDHEQAFNLYIAQPALKSDGLAIMVDEQLSKPHDLMLDNMSKAQIVNAIQYSHGNVCATELVAHPDVFSAVVIQQFVSDDDWENAWFALNLFCRRNFTGACIKQEVAAAAAIRDEDTHGHTPSSRACSLVLSSDTDPIQLERCRNAVRDQHPNEQVMLSCAASVKWHSQTDGTFAGRKIGKCFRDNP